MAHGAILSQEKELKKCKQSYSIETVRYVDSKVVVAGNSSSAHTSFYRQNQKNLEHKQVLGESIGAVGSWYIVL